MKKKKKYPNLCKAKNKEGKSIVKKHPVYFNVTNILFKRLKKTNLANVFLSIFRSHKANYRYFKSIFINSNKI